MSTKRKAILLILIGVFVLACIFASYFWLGLGTPRDIPQTNCIMAADGDTLYYRPNATASGLFQLSKGEARGRKIADDLPESMALLEGSLYYTVGSNVLMRLNTADKDRQRLLDLSGARTFHQILEYEKSADAGPKAGLRIAGTDENNLILYRNKENILEIFSYDLTAEKGGPLFAIRNVQARDVVLSEGQLYIQQGMEEALLGVDLKERKLYTVYDEETVDGVAVDSQHHLIFSPRNSGGIIRYNRAVDTVLYQGYVGNELYVSDDFIYFIDSSHNVVALDSDGNVRQKVDSPFPGPEDLAFADGGFFAYSMGNAFHYFSFQEDTWIF